MQPITFLFLSISTLFGSLSSQPIDGRGNVVIDQGDFSIHDFNIDTSWTYSSFAEVLGKPNRKLNYAESYDSLGMAIVVGSITSNHHTVNVVSEIEIHFSKDPDYSTEDHLPKSYYKRSIIIDGFMLSNFTPYKELKAATPQYNWKVSFIDAFKGDYKGIYIYAHYNDAETELYSVAIGRSDD